VDKQSVIHPTPSQPPTPPMHRHCRSVGWKTAKPFPRVTSRLPRFQCYLATSLVPLLFFYVSTQAVEVREYC
jgi:hypothetical protein